jgi:6-pyruvoyltetrahydropterin/6-carboxytetrahydropterin synthase
MSSEPSCIKHKEKGIFSVEIDGASTGLHFSASHFIYGHPSCGRLHGHNYTVSARVREGASSKGFVIDLPLMEESIRALLSEMDHKILIAKRFARISRNHTAFETADGEIRAPKDSVYLLDEVGTSAELIAKHLLTRLVQKQKANLVDVSSISLGVSESEGRSGWYELV